MKLNDSQREAYTSLTRLWTECDIPRPRAFEMFTLATGYSSVPYFMELSESECKRIVEAMKPDNLLTALEENGKQTCTCMVCGRELTHPDSKTRGIGPVCSGKIFGSSLEGLLK